MNTKILKMLGESNAALLYYINCPNGTAKVEIIRDLRNQEIGETPVPTKGKFFVFVWFVSWSYNKNSRYTHNRN